MSAPPNSAWDAPIPAWGAHRMRCPPEALSQSTEELALSYSWLGLIYDGLNDLDHAELYDQRALKAFRELGDNKREAITLSNLALVVQHRGV
ncbi:MAG: tetratricopeptide repeat protein [Gallionella sp.]|nr:tetratricopeptide repeat protein [Gallionella sp.]